VERTVPDPKRWELTKDIVGEALALPSADRAPYIAKRCGDDAALHAEVVSLLSVETHSGFLKAPDTALRRAAQLTGPPVVTMQESAGDWELKSVIGRGGMGIVYRAQHRGSGQVAAVKVLPASQLPSTIEVRRFERESAAVRALAHPGIVTIVDAGGDEISRWFAMELVEGHDLAKEIRALAGVATEVEHYLPSFRAPGYELAVAELIARVLDAVQHAHEHGIVHRDLKPSNILIDAARTPKIADFGLARSSDDTTITRTNDVGGTVHYMSPEQTRSLHEQIDARSDVWSIGVVLYELLTLEKPFEAPTPQLVQRSIDLIDPAPPHERNRHVPRALSAICLRALEKASKRRYGTAAEFAVHLRRFIAGESVDVTLPGIAARARSLGRRRRVPLIAAAVAVVLTVATVLTWAHVSDSSRARSLIGAVGRVVGNAPFSRSDVADVARARDDALEVAALRPELAAADATLARFEAERAALVARLAADARILEATARTESTPAQERVAAGANAVRLYQDLHVLEPADTRFAAGADPNWSLPIVEVVARDAHGAPIPAVLERVVLDPRTNVALVRTVLGPADRAHAVEAGHARYVVRAGNGVVREFDRSPGIDAMRIVLDATQVEHAPGTLPELVEFTGGTMRLGTEHETSGCRFVGESVEVAPFLLAKHETTIEQYRAFVVATGGARPLHWADVMEEWCDDLPITGLSLAEIDAYLAWAGMRLPTHAEWEYARTGGGVRSMPWGDAPDPARVVSGMPAFPILAWVDPRSDDAARARRELLRNYLRPVGSLPSGNTPQGVADLLGNVAEVVSGPLVEFNGAFIELRDFDRLLLGGSSTYDAKSLGGTHSFQSMFGPSNRPPLVGFRCARSVDP
jgi:formylglycine-generating enzyme required for sulfatase activity/tRNA A-37 threonylcarbamoyl transferase component Bud32